MSQGQPVRFDQGHESPLRTERSGPFTYRHAYARSADSQREGEPGQDYLTFRAEEDQFIFAACDGVSQSFYGNIAAQIVGDELVRWLADDVPAFDDAAALSDSLTAELIALTNAATERVEQQSIPDAPALLHDVLVEKRERGSESMFVCGQIDLGHSRSRGGRIVLAWMGDMRLFLWLGGDLVDLGGVFETDQRWSTRRGLVSGEVNLFYAPLPSDTDIRLVVYSDGLKGIDEQVSGKQSDEALSAAIHDAEISPESDDVTYLELVAQPEPAAIPPGPAPKVVERPAHSPVLPAPAPVIVRGPLVAPPAKPPTSRRRQRATRIAAVGGALLLVALCAVVWLRVRPPSLNGITAALQSLFGIATPTESPAATPTESPAATPTATPAETPTATPTATPTEATSELAPRSGLVVNYS